MSQALLVEVELHEPRFHGRPEWPPSPARLFQALTAGASRGSTIPDAAQRALRWLEKQGPPLVAAPPATQGEAVSDFVPNNDLDAAKGGDLADVGAFRTAKHRKPWLVEGRPTVMYAWPFEEDAGEAVSICELAEDLYQLGRGVDPAWARGSVVSADELNHRMENQGGTVHRPTPGDTGGLVLPCPRVGTLDSLERRFQAGRQRLTPERFDGKDLLVFQQLPRPLLQDVAYDALAQIALFELSHPKEVGAFIAEPLVAAVQLTIHLRDAAARRLREHLPDHASVIEHTLVGRVTDQEERIDAFRRVRIRPLPSIGHHFADPSIRRVLIEVPKDCPLEAPDVFWAFGGLRAPGGGLLTPTDDWKMLGHYRRASRRWRTVTPVALPESAARRGIDSEPAQENSKSASERENEETRGVHAVHQALRHERVDARPRRVEVKREPFVIRRARAEAFAADRFSKERLWHVEVFFDRSVRGPLVIGDGRFLGLGLFEPVRESMEGFAWKIRAGRTPRARPSEITRALRRAVMARVQTALGRGKTLPAWFTGHEPDGQSARDHRHLFYVYDPATDDLAVLAPHLVLRTEPTPREERHLRQLEEALRGFSVLRAGPAGLLELQGVGLEQEVAQAWETVTPYLVRRHAKRTSAEEAVRKDVLSACADARLPRPEGVLIKNPRGIPGEGLQAHVTLRFRRAVAGPIVLGRSRHKGGGWFRPWSEDGGSSTGGSAATAMISG